MLESSEQPEMSAGEIAEFDENAINMLKKIKAVGGAAHQIAQGMSTYIVNMHHADTAENGVISRESFVRAANEGGDQAIRHLELCDLHGITPDQFADLEILFKRNAKNVLGQDWPISN